MLNVIRVLLTVYLLFYSYQKIKTQTLPLRHSRLVQVFYLTTLTREEFIPSPCLLGDKETPRIFQYVEARVSLGSKIENAHFHPSGKLSFHLHHKHPMSLNSCHSFIIKNVPLIERLVNTIYLSGAALSSAVTSLKGLAGSPGL